MALARGLLKGLKRKLKAWKGALDSRWQSVNVKKTTMTIISEKTRTFRIEGKNSCRVSRKGVGSYLIHC